jgi:hypothetical protein
MNTIATPVDVDIGVIEKLRDEELEKARSIQSAYSPVEPLRAFGGAGRRDRAEGARLRSAQTLPRDATVSGRTASNLVLPA